MKLKTKGETFTIEDITSDELDAVYNAIITSCLKDRRQLYDLRTQIEDMEENN